MPQHTAWQSAWQPIAADFTCLSCHTRFQFIELERLYQLELGAPPSRTDFPPAPAPPATTPAAASCTLESLGLGRSPACCAFDGPSVAGAQPADPHRAALVSDGLAVDCEVAVDPRLGCDGLRVAASAPMLLRGDVIGVYPKSNGLQTEEHHKNLKTGAKVFKGEYALILRNRAMYAKPTGRSTGRVNEHAWPNVQFRVVDIDTGDGEPLFTVLALIAIQRIAPHDFIYADYGPAYADVRSMRNYTISPLPGPKNKPLNEGDFESAVRLAFSAEELTLVRDIGGILDFGHEPGSKGDPNRYHGGPARSAKAVHFQAAGGDHGRPRARTASPPPPPSPPSNGDAPNDGDEAAPAALAPSRGGASTAGPSADQLYDESTDDEVAEGWAAKAPRIARDNLQASVARAKRDPRSDIRCTRATDLGNCFLAKRRGGSMADTDRNGACDAFAAMCELLRAGARPLDLDQLKQIAADHNVRLWDGTKEDYCARLITAIAQHVGTQPDLVCSKQCMQGKRCHRATLLAMMATGDAPPAAAPLSRDPPPRSAVAAARSGRLSKTRTDKRKADELAATAAPRPVAAAPPVSRNGLPRASPKLLPCPHCHGRGDVLSFDTYCHGRGEGQSVSRRDGCRCGGGPCALCHIDSCACPWSGGAPLAPHPTRAEFNAVSWGYIDLPLRDQLAPTILIVGEFSGAMAAACQKHFPGHVAITVDYRRSESSAAHQSLHYCGDVRDLLWTRRWRLVVSHPPCHAATKSNTTGRDERIANGELWFSMLFWLMLYCAPADIAVNEQPPSLLEEAYRPPDTRLQFLDYGVPYSKTWCLWHRGGDIQAPPPTSPGATATETAPHRALHHDRDERERLRSRTPPAIADALCSAIDIDARAPPGQPLFHEEVLLLAAGYRKLTGSEPPPRHDDPLARHKVHNPIWRLPAQSWEPRSSAAGPSSLGAASQDGRPTTPTSAGGRPDSVGSDAEGTSTPPKGARHRAPLAATRHPPHARTRWGGAPPPGALKPPEGEPPPSRRTADDAPPPPPKGARVDTGSHQSACERPALGPITARCVCMPSRGPLGGGGTRAGPRRAPPHGPPRAQYAAANTPPRDVGLRLGLGS